MGRLKENKTKQDKTRQNKTKQDKTRQNKTKQKMNTHPTSLVTPSGDITREELRVLLRSLDLDKLDTAELQEIGKLVDELEVREERQRCRDDLIEFCKYMGKAQGEPYKTGAHHRRLADLLMDIEQLKKDRICVSVPPRHGKSQLVSIYYAAWYLGKHPNHKVMLVSHTGDLAVDFGRKVRNLIATSAYHDIFPGVTLAVDSKSAGRWNTNHGGEFFACGVGAALAGRGAHLLIVDDPHSEQDILAGNFDTFDRAYKWFAFGARTRLMPGGRVAVVHTRWAEQDLIGQLVRDMTQNEDTDQYEVFEFPAIITSEEFNDETGEVELKEKALWPEFFDLPALKRTKASMPTYQWNAQYQQNPTGEEAAIVKREWWHWWTREKPPTCEYVIMALDAAAEAHNRADYTALTTWGVFMNEIPDHPNVGQASVILLDCVKERMEFPELKEMALEAYKRWEPDAFIVEKKSSGSALYQEMRRAGLLVQEYTPTRGTTNNPNTKMARLNSVADIVRSGLCWVPQRRWAEEVVEEIAGFPFLAHDDVVDTFIMAMMRFRQGGLISLYSDDWGPDDVERYRQPVDYY